MKGPRTSVLLLLSCAGLLFLFCESTPPSTNDLGIFLAQGREMAERGGFADVDAFSHTVEGERFLNGSWASQRLFYALWRLGGWPLLLTVLAMAVSIAVILSGVSAWRAAGRSSAGAAGAVFAAFLVVQNLGLRPQLFALPLFAGYALLAMTVPPSLLTIAVSALVTAIWVNLHGSFAIAPVLSLLVAAGAAWEDRDALSPAARLHAITAAACVLAACANPWGPSIWLYVSGNASLSTARGLTEWQRTTITDAAGVRLLLAVAALAAVIALRKRLPERRDLPALVAFTGLALTGVRYVVWTAMIFPPVLGRMLTGKSTIPEKRVPVWLAAVAAIFWTAVLVKESPWVAHRGLSGDAEVAARFRDDTPAALAGWAAENGVRGRLFNSMEWGGWFVWRIPEAQSFVDARIWIFPDDVWEDYLRVSRAEPGWEEVLDRRGVEWALLERRFQARLEAAMEQSPQWEKAYEDDIGAVFRRR